MRHAPAATRRRFRSRETLIVLFPVAALLAAGTAFANADVVAVFNCGGTEADGRAAWMDQTQNWTLAQMGAGSGIFDEVEGGNGIKLSLTGDGLGSTGPGGSFTANNNTGGTGPYAIPDALKTLSQGVFKGSTYDTLWGGSVNMWNAGSATLTLGGLTANTEYTVYLFSARANTNGGSVTWKPTDSDSVSASWSVWTVSGDSVTETGNSSEVQFDGSSTGANASIVEVTFTTGADQTSVSFSTNGAQKFTLNGIVVDQGSSIPEPSAFGLLAGLGALALVASRRRRK